MFKHLLLLATGLCLLLPFSANFAGWSTSLDLGNLSDDTRNRVRLSASGASCRIEHSQQTGPEQYAEIATDGSKVEFRPWVNLSRVRLWSQSDQAAIQPFRFALNRPEPKTRVATFPWPLFAFVVLAPFTLLYRR